MNIREAPPPPARLSIIARLLAAAIAIGCVFAFTEWSIHRHAAHAPAPAATSKVSP